MGPKKSILLAIEKLKTVTNPLKRKEEFETKEKKIPKVEKDEEKEVKILVPVIQEEIECPICYENTKDYKKLQCEDKFCLDCLKKHIKTQVFPIPCPNPKCQDTVSPMVVKELMDEEFYKKYEDRSLSNLTEKEPDIFSCCPTPGCGYIFVFDADESPHFRCEKCLKHYCLKCKCEYHKNRTCIQYIRERVNNPDEMFIQFALGKKFKQCPGCKRWIEKNEGCLHMRCLCGFDFCYECGRAMEGCQCN